jgi:chaperonin GroES
MGRGKETKIMCDSEPLRSPVRCRNARGYKNGAKFSRFLPRFSLKAAARGLNAPLLALAHGECQKLFRRIGRIGAAFRISGTARSRPFEGIRKGNTMGFRPLHDRVLVRRVEAEEKTAGGIIIPDSAQEKPQEGEVVAAGSGLKAEDGKVTPLDVKKGDRILFGKWSGTEVKLDGEELLIMKESDILGIVA